MRLLLPPLFTLALGLWLAVSGTQAQYDDLSMAFIQMNQARQIKRISPLAWDNDLAMYAQYWADQIATGAVPFSHAPPSLRPQQGENLYQRQSSQPDWAYYNTFQTAVAAWVEEGPLWRGQAVGDGSEPWLHWSQIMWTTTTHVGCAKSISTVRLYQAVTVCRFWPPGNFVGQTPF